MPGSKGLRQHRELMASLDELREVCLRYKRGADKIRQLMDQGTPAVDALIKANAVQMRQELTQAMERVEAARRGSRVLLLEVAAEEGDSASEFARAIGVSRQLASRLAGETTGR